MLSLNWGIYQEKFGQILGKGTVTNMMLCLGIEKAKKTNAVPDL